MLPDIEAYERLIYTLPETFPHHKHIPPDIKRHRVPASGISFEHPNLPFLIREIEDTFLQ